MEAMAFGKPVVTTKHAGVPELAKEVLIEEGNVEKLAEAIETLRMTRICVGDKVREIEESCQKGLL